MRLQRCFPKVWCKVIIRLRQCFPIMGRTFIMRLRQCIPKLRHKFIMRLYWCFPKVEHNVNMRLQWCFPKVWHSVICGYNDTFPKCGIDNVQHCIPEGMGACLTMLSRKHGCVMRQRCVVHPLVTMSRKWHDMLCQSIWTTKHLWPLCHAIKIGWWRSTWACVPEENIIAAKLFHNNGSLVAINPWRRKGSLCLYQEGMKPNFCQLYSNGYCLAQQFILTCGRHTTSSVQLAMTTVQ